MFLQTFGHLFLMIFFARDIKATLNFNQMAETFKTKIVFFFLNYWFSFHKASASLFHYVLSCIVFFRKLNMGKN